MLLNDTGEDIFLDADGNVVGPKDEHRATLLVAAGSTLPDDLAKRHKLEGRLTQTAGRTFVDEATGQEYVHHDGRAFAAGVLGDAPLTQVVRRPRTVLAESKMQRPQEDKSGPAPAHVAVPAPAAPAARAEVTAPAAKPAAKAEPAKPAAEKG